MILVSLLMSFGGTIILDEPGLSLHPSKRSILRRAILSCSKDNSVIMITHATEMIEEDTFPLTTRCFKKNGSSQAIPLSVLDTKLMLQVLEPQFKSLLFCENALFVEGKTDNRVFNIFYDMCVYDYQLQQLLREEQCNSRKMYKWTIIQLNGATTSSPCIKLTELFNIKWKVLLDGDQKEHRVYKNLCEVILVSLYTNCIAV